MEYYEFRAMNTDIVLAAEGAPERLEAGFTSTRRFIKMSEARFTRFSPDSELSRLNAASGTLFQASAELFDVVDQALFYARQTGGIFDPTILAALEASGYDRSMDEIRLRGAGPRRNAPAGLHSWQDIRCDARQRFIFLPPGTRIDLGGIAKGWIAERAAQVLAGFTPACVVNAGGDMFAIGTPTGDPAWQVAVDDPRNEQNIVALLRVGPGAVATSSITKRRWLQGDRWQHHLIDPRRRVPAQTDWLSVTVIAASATEAEVYAKVLLIAGSKEGPGLVDGRSDLAFIAVDQEGELWGSATARAFMEGVETSV
jgi:thiamine biosynthesis lipoprotein